MKGWKLEAVGDNPVRRPGLMNGSLSTCDTESRKPRPRGLAGGVVDTAQELPGRSLVDLPEPSAAEKAASLVSGVPANESGTPPDECGDDGPNTLSRACAILNAFRKGRWMMIWGDLGTSEGVRCDSKRLRPQHEGGTLVGALGSGNNEGWD